MDSGELIEKLWFDVGIKRYTTLDLQTAQANRLWFDVGIKRYTTIQRQTRRKHQLWFDVGIKRYTTSRGNYIAINRCGLM